MTNEQVEQKMPLIIQAIEKGDFSQFVADNKDSEGFVDYVLDALDQERNKFTKSDKDIIESLTNILIDLGVYPKNTPAMKHMTNGHISMVECWGARWHEFSGILNCPKCGADWRNHASGPPFKREIGIEISSVYDGVAYYECPDCFCAISRNGNIIDAESVNRSNFTII